MAPRVESLASSRILESHQQVNVTFHHGARYGGEVDHRSRGMPSTSSPPHPPTRAPLGAAAPIPGLPGLASRPATPHPNVRSERPAGRVPGRATTPRQMGPPACRSSPNGEAGARSSSPWTCSPSTRHHQCVFASPKSLVRLAK
jgi:hypothetical protein